MCAEDPYLAEDAAELVHVDVDELDPVLDARDGAAPGAPELHEGHGNECITLRRGYGDVDGAFARAAHTSRSSCASGATRPCRSRPAASSPSTTRSTGRFTLWGMTKVPHFNRGILAEALGVPPSTSRCAARTRAAASGRAASCTPRTCSSRTWRASCAAR